MMPTHRKIVVIGASRGIGAAVTQHFVAQGDHVMAVSRSQAVAGEWVKADISTKKEGIRTVVIAVGDSPLDALLFMGGVWEAGAFTSQYD